MVDIQSATAEIRRGKKKEERNKPQDENIMVYHYTGNVSGKLVQMEHAPIFRRSLVHEERMRPGISGARALQCFDTVCWVTGRTSCQKLGKWLLKQR